MADEWTEFFNNYDALVRDVGLARYQNFPLQLTRWFSCLETWPRVAAIVRTLEGRVDFDSWIQKANATQGGMVGSGSLPWSANDDYLAEQIAVCRALADQRLSAPNFFRSFLYIKDLNFDGAVQTIVREIFSPMAADLKRLLRRRLSADEPEASIPAPAPASDRIVRFNHNSAPYIQAIEALGAVEEALRGLNDFPNPEQKEQIVAELAAGRQLFRAPLVRVAAVGLVLGGALGALTTSFPDSPIGILSSAAWAAIIAAFAWAAKQDRN